MTSMVLQPCNAPKSEPMRARGFRRVTQPGIAPGSGPSIDFVANPIYHQLEKISEDGRVRENKLFYLITTYESIQNLLYVSSQRPTLIVNGHIAVLNVP